MGENKPGTHNENLFKTTTVFFLGRYAFSVLA